MKNEPSPEGLALRSEPASQLLRVDPTPFSGPAADETISQTSVERLVLQLNALCKSATLNFALSVGNVVVANLYCGDLDRWRSRNPNKDYSLRKLAKHPALPMSPNALYRCIAIFEVCERLGIRSWKHVSTSHVRLVLPLPLGEQAKLLEAAEANRWPARRLDDEVAALMRRDPSSCQRRGGRKRASQLTEKMRTVEKVITTLNELLEPDEHAITDPSPDSARAAIDLLQKAAQRCAILRERLARHVPSAPADLPPAFSTAREA
jgi:hypothetical protein